LETTAFNKKFLLKDQGLEIYFGNFPNLNPKINPDNSKQRWFSRKEEIFI